MARERYARYMAVPKTERGQQLAQTLQARFSEYAAALDAQYSALKENAVPRYQEGQRKLRQIDEGFTKDMQAFLGRVAERSDAVLDSSQRTYARPGFRPSPCCPPPCCWPRCAGPSSAAACCCRCGKPACTSTASRAATLPVGWKPVPTMKSAPCSRRSSARRRRSDPHRFNGAPGRGRDQHRLGRDRRRQRQPVQPHGRTGRALSRPPPPWNSWRPR